MSKLIEITGGLVYLEIALFILILVVIILNFINLIIIYKQQMYKKMLSCFMIIIIYVIWATFIAGKIYGQLSILN